MEENLNDSEKINVVLETGMSEEFHLKKLAVRAAVDLLSARANVNIHLSLDDIEKRFPIMYNIVYNKIKKNDK